MKKILVSLLILTMFSGCATVFCTLMCDDDQTCYNTCRIINDGFEEDIDTWEDE